MTKLLLFSCLALVLCSGCLFRKSSQPKANTSVSGEVEEVFRKRWMDKRVAELVAQGTSAEAALIQAEAEFRNAYDFSKTASQK